MSTLRLGVGVFLLVLVAGCGGKSSGLGSVTTNDLAIMVLPAAELGARATGLVVDSDSGFQDAAAVAEDTLDPDDTADDIEATGLEASYELDYTNADASSAPTQVSTEVTLFGSAEEAQSFVETNIGQAEQYEGTDLGNGAEVTSVEVTELDGPGDTAWRGVATASAGGADITSSVVAFTVDRVAASVAITKLDDVATAAELDELALELEDRIRAVADDEVTGSPVPIPAETSASSSEAEDPVLEQMVLDVEDLPAGVTVKDDGFVTKDGDTSFERDFALGNATIGTSELIGLQSNVEQMDNAAQASLAVAAVAQVIKGPEGADLFANAFGAGAGFDATSVKITELPAEGIGDRTTALRATFDTRAGPFEAVFVFIASGRAAGQIYAAAAKGKVEPDDILALARTMAQKMEAGR